MFANRGFSQKVGEVRRVRRQKRGADPSRVQLPLDESGGVQVPSVGCPPAGGKRDDGLGRGHIPARDGGTRPYRCSQHAERHVVERLKAAGLARAPPCDAFPEELTTARLVEGDVVSCGRNGPRLRARFRITGGPAPRCQEPQRGTPGG